MRWGTKLTRLEKAELRDSFLKLSFSKKNEEKKCGQWWYNGDCEFIY